LRTGAELRCTGLDIWPDDSNGVNQKELKALSPFSFCFYRLLVAIDKNFLFFFGRKNLADEEQEKAWFGKLCEIVFEKVTEGLSNREMSKVRKMLNSLEDHILVFGEYSETSPNITTGFIL